MQILSSMIILSTFNEFISVLLSYGKNKTEILRFLVEVYVERLSSDIKFDKVDHVKLVFVRNVLQVPPLFP